MKNLPEGYWTLYKVIHERIVPYYKAALHPDLLNPIVGLPQPKDTPKIPDPTANERYWIQWTREFSEIHSSIERLNQSLVYLTHFPASRGFRFHGLSEADWLRYHVEVYLQEAYILVARLTRFLRRVEKTAAGSCDRGGVTSARRMKALVDNVFAGVVKARSGHVHKYRFEDAELRNLDSLVLLTGKGKLRKLRFVRKLKYVSALEKWRKQLRQNNKESLKLCVYLFEATTEIITRNEPPRATKATA